MRLDAFKGPYFVEYGDFATAGAVNFVLRDFVEENYAEAAGGSYGTQRYLTPALTDARRAQDADRGGVLPERRSLRAPERLQPVQHPRQGEGHPDRRHGPSPPGPRTTGASWHGSGEIPVRAVRAGLLSRFGAIDANEGGQTQRANLNVDWTWRLDEAQTIAIRGYGSYYTLDLFNNFTFFLNDPVNGAEMIQRDRRFLAGLDAQYQHRSKPFGVNLISTAGFQYRIDNPARGAGDVHPAPPDRPHSGRQHHRAVLRTLREVRPRALSPGFASSRERAATSSPTT